MQVLISRQEAHRGVCSVACKQHERHSCVSCCNQGFERPSSWGATPGDRLQKARRLVWDPSITYRPALFAKAARTIRANCLDTLKRTGQEFPWLASVIYQPFGSFCYFVISAFCIRILVVCSQYNHVYHSCISPWSLWRRHLLVL